MKYSLIVICVLLFSACSDDHHIDHELIGQWQLIEQYIDPGDGSGTYEKVDSQKTLEFFNNGWINTKGTLCNISIDTDEDGNATYSSKDQLIYPKACTSSDFVLSYEIIDDYLYLYYPCIEGCSQKFKKK